MREIKITKLKQMKKKLNTSVRTSYKGLDALDFQREGKENLQTWTLGWKSPSFLKSNLEEFLEEVKEPRSILKVQRKSKSLSVCQSAKDSKI